MNTGETHIVVAVCTLKRPKMLKKCLISIAKQSLPNDCKLTVIVVENDAAEPSKGAVEVLYKTHFEPKNINLVFANEPKTGIPFARNKTLELAKKLRPDWICLLDDDETAAPDWIKSHIESQESFNADVLQGRVEYEYEITPPIWFKRPRSKKRHGQILKRAATNNVMFSFNLIDPSKHNLSFDTHFTQGHEDTEFFERALKSGATIVFNERAVVTEFVTASRLDYRRHVQRMFQHAVTGTYEQIYKRGWWYAFFRQILTLKHYSRFLRALIALIVVPIIWPFSKTGAQKAAYYSVKRLSKVFGAFYGLTNRQIRYWDTIDGF